MVGGGELHSLQHRLLLTPTPTDQQADRTAKHQPEKSKQHLAESWSGYCQSAVFTDMSKTDD